LLEEFDRFITRVSELNESGVGAEELPNIERQNFSDELIVVYK
jgi:hypothetical protein